MQRGRAALPGARFSGLIDPALPHVALPGLDGVYRNAYAAGMPECFVRLAAGTEDETVTARLLQHGVPSVALDPAPRDAMARYWLSRTGPVVTPGTIWDVVAHQLASGVRAGGGASPKTAVLTAIPQYRMPHAAIFGPEVLPLLSARFQRVLFVLGNTAADAALIRLLVRYGGEVLLTESCLLAAYPDGRERAAAELGRKVPAGEWRQWCEGIARPAALLLGEMVAAAARVFVHSDWLAAEIRARYGVTATVVPAKAAPVVTAHAAGLQAECCVWALEMLRFWGVDIRLSLDCPPGERDALTALAARLGVADALTFGAGPAAVRLFLAMRGQASHAAALLEAAGQRCIASQSVADGAGAPVPTVPDQPSPPLLAEAIRAALAP